MTFSSCTIPMIRCPRRGAEQVAAGTAVSCISLEAGAGAGYHQGVLGRGGPGAGAFACARVRSRNVDAQHLGNERRRPGLRRNAFDGQGAFRRSVRQTRAHHRMGQLGRRVTAVSDRAELSGAAGWDHSQPVVSGLDIERAIHHRLCAAGEFFDRSDSQWSEEQKTAISGFATWRTCHRVAPRLGNWPTREAIAMLSVPAQLIYDPARNPGGLRCDYYSNLKNVLGARRPLDNVGVQYGLAAYNAGALDAEHFPALNEAVGGFDEDGRITSSAHPGRAGDRYAWLTSAAWS